ncbi:hypothetical protein O181_094208 [Austropuccinia psidii MF-1]|uniref:Uncharacterized protein n=1 Tax=Austropuccinia psidii MF-1 TaxID=1389203 RepID=A0A9Q3PA27_9BASI|nr:hypothetical protein [Austropuccinia psidii MF-1]
MEDSSSKNPLSKEASEESHDSGKEELIKSIQRQIRHLAMIADDNAFLQRQIDLRNADILQLNVNHALRDQMLNCLKQDYLAELNKLEETLLDLL